VALLGRVVTPRASLSKATLRDRSSSELPNPSSMRMGSVVAWRVPVDWLASSVIVARPTLEMITGVSTIKPFMPSVGAAAELLPRASVTLNDAVAGRLIVAGACGVTANRMIAVFASTAPTRVWKLRVTVASLGPLPPPAQPRTSTRVSTAPVADTAAARPIRLRSVILLLTAIASRCWASLPPSR